MPAVYDDEKEKTGIKPHHDGSHDDLGVHPERREAEAEDLENLYNAESAPESGSGGKAEDREQEKLDDQVGKGFTDDENTTKATGRAGGRRKQGIIAGSLVTLAVAGGGMGFLAAPNFIVNHMRELLLGKLSEIQTHNSLRYRRAKIRKISDMFTKDGRRASKLVSEMEARGYKPKWNGNTLLGFDRPDGRTGTFGLGTIEEIETHLERKHPLRSSRWKTKQMEAAYNRYNIPRKSVVFLDSNDLDESVDRVMNKRVAQGVLADDPASSNALDEAAPENGEETPEQQEAREARNARARELVEKDGTLDEVREKIKNGTPLSELNPDERAVLRIGAEFDDELIRMINEFADVGLGGRIMGGIKGIASSAVADIADKVCTIKGRLAGAIFAARVYRARDLMRYASVFVSASDQTRTGNVDPRMMNELMKRVTSLDGNDMPIGASSGFSYMLRGKFSKAKNDASKSTYSVDGSLTGISKVFHDATNRVPGTSEGQCAVWQNPITQIGAGVVEIGIGIFTGGAGKGATAGIGASIKAGFNAALRNMVSRQALKSLAWTAAVELSFEGALALLQIQAEKALSLNFTGQETGAQLGEILVAGGGTLNKQRSLQAGMVPATTAQYAQAKSEYIAWKKEETKKQSLYTRIFDYNNLDSVAFNLATVAVTMPTTPTAVGQSVGQLLNKTATTLLSRPQILASNIGDLYLEQANAQSGNEIEYDSFQIKDTDISLATDHAGNLLPILPAGIENIDPQKNIEELIADEHIESEEPYKPKSDAFKNHMVNCVESVDTLSTLERAKDNPSGPEDDCLAVLPLTKKFKAHLAYLDMVDGIDAWLFPDQIDDASGSGSTPNPTGDAPSTVDLATLFQPSDSVACAAGSRDIGIHDGYHAGNKISVRLCAIDAIPETGSSDNLPGANGKLVVNSRMSAIYTQLAQDAIAAGVQVSASEGFRTMARQEYFWNCYQTKSCNSGNLAARPGTSNHQAGVAVDWSPAVYNWLSTNGNAAKYGLKKCTCGEQWHYSPTGG